MKIASSAPHSRLRFNSQRSRSPLIVAAQNQGPTGLNVGGFRPTSRGGWEQMKATLQSAKVKLLSPQELSFASDKGDVKILDVRPADVHQQAHIPGAFNVPFYQPIEGWSPWQVVRRVGYAAFGVLNGTEPNPAFLTDVERMVKKDEQLVVYCNIGGSLEGDTEFKRGRQTRSIIAAYQLVVHGFTNVSVLRGGFSGWAKAGRSIATTQDVASSEEGSTAANRTASP